MKTTAIVFFLLSCVNLSENYRILGIFPLPSKSHMVMFERLMKGLAEKGHEVDVVSYFPQKKPIPRYNDLSLGGVMPIFVNNISISLAQARMGSYYGTIEFIIADCGLNPCKAMFNSTVGQNLKNTDKKYDLVITEVFGSDCMLGFAHHFNIPAISMTSSVNLPWGGDRIGNPDNPSYIPNYLLPYLSKMTLTQRVFNTVMLLASKLGHEYSKVVTNSIIRQFFGPEIPDVQDLVRNTSLLFVNSHFSINYPRPAVPNFVEVGGIHIEPLKPLSKHLNDSLKISGKYKGVIYLSMGSMILTETLPVEKLSAFFETFRELPYKVLWKASREKMPKELDIPSNIQFETWMPQLDILCHPNVKLFISHGGLMGTQESIYCGVPRLGIPLFADQELNLKASQAMDLAVMVHYEDITKERILEAAKTLLENPKYKENAEKISKRFRDRPASALETAIYWVEYVIRHNGAPHLRTVGADLPWYQYLLLDVIFILFTTLITFLVLVYLLIMYVLRMFGYVSKSKVKSKKH